MCAYVCSSYIQGGLETWSEPFTGGEVSKYFSKVRIERDAHLKTLTILGSSSI